MTRDDLRIFCTALGFTAVILKDEPADNQALRATTISRLIESFCLVTVPDALGATNENFGGDSDTTQIDQAIDRFKAELVTRQDARLPEDKATLCLFYTRLQQRQAQRRQKPFLSKATEDVIANHVLHMIDEEIEHDGGAA